MIRGNLVLRSLILLSLSSICVKIEDPGALSEVFDEFRVYIWILAFL